MSIVADGVAAHTFVLVDFVRSKVLVQSLVPVREERFAAAEINESEDATCCLIFRLGTMVA